MIKKLQSIDGKYIEYEHVEGCRKHGVTLFGGYGTNIESTKALALRDFCLNNEFSFTRFSYLGHGSSDATINNSCVSDWKQNCLDIINLTDKKQIIVGSSLGGWLMMLVAIQIPEKVQGLIGIAAAPDFPMDMMANCPEMEDCLNRDGYYAASEDRLPVYKKMVNDAKGNLILDKDVIDVHCPVRLLHGIKDDVVYYKKSYAIAAKLSSNNVRVHTVEHADHRMNDETSFYLTCKMISELASIS